MEALLHHYDLVLEPSWTGYASLDLLAFTRYRRHSIVLLSPFRGDREFLEVLGSNLVPIELGPGDWVDPRAFRPLRRAETLRHGYDRAMELYEAPRPAAADPAPNRRSDFPRRARGHEPGAGLGPEGVLTVIESCGLRQQIDVFEDLAPGEVNRILNQSKVNVLLSCQEGGNRGLFEGFFAGVPGVALRNHIGIRTEHFRPETGRLIDRATLAAELLYFREHWSLFNPRPWALSHITPEISTRRLNEFLKHRAMKRGEPWTKDIVMKCNRPGLRYYPDDGAGEGLPRMEYLLTQFPPGSASGLRA